jgi:prepilin-type N-terminal cleavage/methylation domain-containing protein
MKKRGFTLVELMIAISIITLLTTMVTVGLLKAKGNAKIQTTRALIANIQAGIENYYGAFGDYPPTSLEDSGMSVNGVNNGIESVVVCLSTSNKGGPFLLGVLESKYKDLDNDNVREIIDEWNHPLIYFHSRDYDNPGKGGSYSFRKTGDAINPPVNPATMTYYNPYTFQIWSVGPDEKNNNGLLNDINNWE